MFRLVIGIFCRAASLTASATIQPALESAGNLQRMDGTLCCQSRWGMGRGRERSNLKYRA
jgi:hypothetical protein